MVCMDSMIPFNTVMLWLAEMCFLLLSLSLSSGHWWYVPFLSLQKRPHFNARLLVSFKNLRERFVCEGEKPFLRL